MCMALVLARSQPTRPPATGSGARNKVKVKYNPETAGGCPAWLPGGREEGSGKGGRGEGGGGEREARAPAVSEWEEDSE